MFAAIYKHTVGFEVEFDYYFQNLFNTASTVSSTHKKLTYLILIILNVIIFLVTQQISDDVLTEVRGLQALVEGASEKVDECSAGIENPTITEQVQIAQCIAQVYLEFSADLLNVIHIVS